MKKSENRAVSNIFIDPLTPDDLQSGKVRAYAENLLTGETHELTTKPDSVCHFFEHFECGGYIVQLRLHWKDLDNQGNPRLDADFINHNTGKIDKSMKKHPAHHTSAQGDKERTYPWEFKDESRKLRVTLTLSMSVASGLNFGDSVSVKQTRAGEDIP